MRRLRYVVQPSWLALHAITVALVVTMILLGRWQLTVSERKGFSLQNFGYALQWWAFSIFVLGMWARSMRDAYRKSTAAVADAGIPEGRPEPISIRPAPVTYRRYVMPTQNQQSDDPLHSAYNDYLAQIAASDLASAELTVPDVTRHVGTTPDSGERS